MSWTSFGPSDPSHPFFGRGVLVADLGPYTGEWPPRPAAIRIGTYFPDLIEVDLVVGTPHPSGDVALFGDGSYPADLYDAYRFGVFRIVDGEFLGGSGVGAFPDSPGGGSGDLSSMPAGAHLVLAWYPNSYVGFGNPVATWPVTPALEPEEVAPAGYAASATGPTLPSPAGTAWSDWRTEDEYIDLVDQYLGLGGYTDFTDYWEHLQPNVGQTDAGDEDAAASVQARFDTWKTGPFPSDFSSDIGHAFEFEWHSTKTLVPPLQTTSHVHGAQAALVVSYTPRLPAANQRPDYLNSLDELIDWIAADTDPGNTVQAGASYQDSELPTLVEWTEWRPGLFWTTITQWTDSLDAQHRGQVGIDHSDILRGPSIRAGWVAGDVLPLGWQAYGHGDFLASFTPPLLSDMTVAPTGGISDTRGVSYDVTLHDIGDTSPLTLIFQWSWEGDAQPDLPGPVNYTAPTASSPSNFATNPFYEGLLGAFSVLRAGNGGANTDNQPLGFLADVLLPPWRYLVLTGAPPPPPPPPVTVHHPLRLHQRDDGLGSSGSTPRLAGSTGASPPTSKQLGRVPRVGNPNRYS